MSNLIIQVHKSALNQSLLDDNTYRQIMVNFVVGLKSAFAETISTTYDVKYTIAMDIIKIHENPLKFEIGIDNPEMYSGKIKNIVLNILKYDLGSLTEKIQPMLILKNYCDSLSGSVSEMWLQYLLKLDWGD